MPNTRSQPRAFIRGEKGKQDSPIHRVVYLLERERESVESGVMSLSPAEKYLVYIADKKRNVSYERISR